MRRLSPPFPSYSRSHDMSDQPVSTGAAAPAQNGPQFSAEKIYVKDVSFEAPGEPAVLNEQAPPQLPMNLHQRVLSLTATPLQAALAHTLPYTLRPDNTAYLDHHQ